MRNIHELIDAIDKNDDIVLTITPEEWDAIFKEMLVVFDRVLDWDGETPIDKWGKPLPPPPLKQPKQKKEQQKTHDSRRRKRVLRTPRKRIRRGGGKRNK